MATKRAMDERTACYFPVGEIRMAQHPHFCDIIDRVLGGWTAASIEDWLGRTGFLPILSPGEINAYAQEHIPPWLLIPEAFIGSVPQAGDLDERAVLQQAAIQQLHRVSRLCEEEDRAAAADVALGYNRRIRGEMEQLRKLLVASADLKFNLGILKRGSYELTLMPDSPTPTDAGLPGEEEEPLSDQERGRVAMLLAWVMEPARVETRREDGVSEGKG